MDLNIAKVIKDTITASTSTTDEVKAKLVDEVLAALNPYYRMSDTIDFGPYWLTVKLERIDGKPITQPIEITGGTFRGKKKMKQTLAISTRFGDETDFKTADMTKHFPKEASDA